MTFSRLIAIVVLTATSLPALAASEDDVYTASQFLRCASFYVFGLKSVSRPELKEQLQNLANTSIYSAELLMDRDRPAVKAEFDNATDKFLAEIDTPEVKSDTRGFLKYMGEYCNALRDKNQARLSKLKESGRANADTPAGPGGTAPESEQLRK
ncbi:MAG: hypothetical protein JWQ21_3313 [Herminiimonas sp.]|nr:hypothetical protein [Herminiimonas sp.]